MGHNLRGIATNEETTGVFIKVLTKIVKEVESITKKTVVSIIPLGGGNSSFKQKGYTPIIGYLINLADK